MPKSLVLPICRVFARLHFEQNCLRSPLHCIMQLNNRPVSAFGPIVWGVIAKFNLLVHGHKKLNVNKSNADLWRWILQSTDRLGRHRIELTKVPAHRRVSSATTKFEAWMFYYNDVADRTARQANQDRPSRFWDVWEAHVRAVGAAEIVFQQVRELHLAVGRRQVQSHVSADSGDHVPGPVRQTREFAPSFQSWTLGDGCLLPRVARLYGSTVMQKICQWFLGRLADKADLVWVSFAQFVTWIFKLQLDTLDHYVSMAPVGGRRTETVFDGSNHSRSSSRTKWFRLCLKHLWKEAGVSVGMEQCRPTSTAITGISPLCLPSLGRPFVGGCR